MKLIVEDNELIIKLIKMKYKCQNTLFVNNLEDAYSVFSNNKENIELIICDHNFPKKNKGSIKESGHLFFEKIKNEYENTFIHFSSTPCEEKYNKNKFNGVFISNKKNVNKLKNHFK